MQIVTTETVPNREIAEVLGLVSANSVRSRNVGRDILAGIKSLFGGEIHAYTKLMSDTRVQVLEKLEASASAMGADAIVCTRMMSSDVGQNMAEVYMYGTAVKLK